jgi:multidrug efflux pump subunit AcrA (membrane-fusion protein)
VFEPTTLTDVRPLVQGTVDRVLVREGDEVGAGAVLAQMSDIEAQLARSSALASVRAASRNASLAASRGDAAEQRLQAIREDAARAELALRDEELSRLAIRAPMPGVVLTSRPELLRNTRVAAGAPFIVLGRTDTLELSFAVEQNDIERVHVGDEVRLRLEGMPQHTYAGHVSVVGALPLSMVGATIANGSVRDSSRVLYPVRAVVPNVSGALRPGMVAHARVLTAPSSVAGRMLRKPTRVMRLLWWRMWSWL